MLALVPSAPPQIANGAVTDALDGAPARGAGADVPGSTFGGLADGCGSADGDAVSPGSPAMLSSPGRSIAEADPAKSGQAEAVPSSEARGSGAGTSGMASGALGEEYEEFTADEDSADEDDIADEDIAAAVSAAEMDAEVRAAAVDSEAVVMLAEEADTGAGAEAELEGLGGSMLTAGRSSSGPVAKAAAGTLDAFLPQSDATGMWLLRMGTVSGRAVCQCNLPTWRCRWVAVVDVSLRASSLDLWLRFRVSIHERYSGDLTRWLQSLTACRSGEAA